jgi:hypothetical protein
MAVHHAYCADVIALGQQQFNYSLPVAVQGWRIGDHPHFVLGLGYTRRL